MVLFRFLSYFCFRSRILLFHMCFGIRISRCFHLATQIISIQNPNFPKKNTKTCSSDMIFGILFFQLLEWSSNLNDCGYHYLLQYHVLPGTACIEQWQTQQALVATGCDRRQHALHRQAIWRQGDQQEDSPKIMSTQEFFTFLGNLDSDERI